jgi:hypothetical protein
MLLIDTQGHPRYYYRNLILLAKSVGFDVDYRNFYDLLQNDQISNYSTVFFVMSSDLVKNIKHPLSQKIIKIIEDYTKLGNKMVAVLLPSTSTFNKNVVAVISQLLETFNIIDETQPKKVQEHMGSALNTYVSIALQNDAQIGSLFGTTLINKKPVTLPKIKDNQGNILKNILDEYSREIIAATLPQYGNFSEQIQKTLPAGFYLKNKKTNTIFLISKASAFTFADIVENFFRCPYNLHERNELLQVAQQMLLELFQVQSNHMMPNIIQKQLPPLPIELTQDFILHEKNRAHKTLAKNIKKNGPYSWIINEGIVAAWEAPEDYFLNEDEKKLQAMRDQHLAQELKDKALIHGVQFIYDARINLVWLEFNPEIYLSKNARLNDKKEIFIKQVKALAKAFKSIFNLHKKKLPNIFMGTDITTNFSVNPIHTAVQDVFGHTYSKIPAPLDFDNFWKPELIETFAAFIKHFHAQLPISGIFLDFEMYHAQDQAGGYSQHMDFSSSSWHIYCQQTKTCNPHESSVNNRVNHLLKHHAFNHYFQVLEYNALTLGKKIKKQLRAIVPDILIGVYMPTLPNSWFYRGMLSGLSSKSEPVIAATFNADFYSHYTWLRDQNIHCVHGAPILLSKIQSPQDFQLLTYVMRYHDFFWVSRPSRMLYREKKGRWWSSEASPMDPNILAKGIARAD